jgi:hypothetical protein
MVTEYGTIPSPQGIRSPESTKTPKRSNDNDLCEENLGDVNVKGITDILKMMGESVEAITLVVSQTIKQLAAKCGLTRWAIQPKKKMQPRSAQSSI